MDLHLHRCIAGIQKSHTLLSGFAGIDEREPITSQSNTLQQKLLSMQHTVVGIPLLVKKPSSSSNCHGGAVSTCVCPWLGIEPKRTAPPSHWRDHVNQLGGLGPTPSDGLQPTFHLCCEMLSVSVDRYERMCPISCGTDRITVASDSPRLVRGDSGEPVGSLWPRAVVKHLCRHWDVNHHVWFFYVFFFFRLYF